jgi:hypothetical protein
VPGSLTYTLNSKGGYMQAWYHAARLGPINQPQGDRLRNLVAVQLAIDKWEQARRLQTVHVWWQPTAANNSWMLRDWVNQYHIYQNVVSEQPHVEVARHALPSELCWSHCNVMACVSMMSASPAGWHIARGQGSLEKHDYPQFLAER